MQATIYIPNYNGRARLSLLLDSLAVQTVGCRAVLVDNGSDDGSVAMVRSDFPAVAIVELDRNVGFGRALNRAIGEHGGDPLILLNNDVRCEPDFVAAMLDALGGGVEMVAGVLVKERSPELVDTAGIVADRRTLMAFDYLNGHRVDSISGTPPPLAPSGGAALYRRAAFEGVGGFDERIFAYLEDVDLALRLRRAGGSCRLASTARGVHEHSATLGSGSRRKDYLMGWGRGYLLRKWNVITPRRLPGIAVREIYLGLGQALVDRNLGGIRGRIEGLRTGRPIEPYPSPLPDPPTLLDTLRRRWRRRSRLRGR